MAQVGMLLAYMSTQESVAVCTSQPCNIANLIIGSFMLFVLVVIIVVCWIDK